VVGTSLVVTNLKDVRVLRLEAEDGYPRLERAVLCGIEKEIGRLARDAAVRGAVITGTAQAFAAGAEIEAITALRGDQGFEFSRLGQAVFRGIERSPKPVIAAIRGYCMGGGLDLALACRARIAAKDAVFGHPGGAIGIITGWGGTQRLTRLIGRGRAIEMFTTGARLNADDAFASGLVSRVVTAGELLAAAVLTLWAMADQRAHANEPF